MLRRMDLKDFFFEIDIQIPIEFYDSVKDFVFSRVNRLVPRDLLSPYNLFLAEDGFIP